MSVFAGDVQTPLAVPDPKSDYKLPVPSQLNYGGITGTGALAGTTGHDTLLLTGDRDRQMNGNESTRISMDRSHTVSGNQKKQISGNKNEDVTGNFLQQTIGNQHRTVIGATNELFTATHTIAHKDPQKMEQPESHYHDLKEKLEKANLKIDDFILYQLHSGTVQNFIGHNLDIKGIQNAVIGLLAEKHVICAAEKDVDVKLKQLHTQVGELKSEVGAIEPVVYITKVHEVALTQKILVIGVNQFM